MFCAINHQSTRFYLKLCEFIDLIAKKFEQKFINPLGNKLYEHKMGIKHAHQACFSALREEKKQSFREISPITHLEPKIMVAADKGTMHKDSSRQVIVATAVGDDETLITASSVTEASALGTAVHFKKEVSDIFCPKNISAICTDGAAYYTGHENGMVALLKKDLDFHEKMVFLPDLCHKTEILFDFNPPRWLLDALANIKIIAALVNNSSILGQGLVKYSEVSNKNYVTMSFVPETRFTEYIHIQLQSV